MLKHIVIFKLKKDVQPPVAAALEKDLAALPSSIPEIREFLVGRDVVHSQRSYDIALVSAFDSLDDMQKYQVHPAHQAVAAKLREISENIATVDFEY